jgi:hypothetical protein
LYQGLYPPDDYDGNLDRTLTGDSYKVASHKSSTISERFRLPLLAWVRTSSNMEAALVNTFPGLIWNGVRPTDHTHSPLTAS